MAATTTYISTRKKEINMYFPKDICQFYASHSKPRSLMHCAVILQTGPKIGGIKAKFLQSGFKLTCSLYGRIYVWPLIQKKLKQNLL